MHCLRLISFAVLAVSVVFVGQPGFAQTKIYPDYCDNPRPGTPGWKWKPADVCIKHNLSNLRTLNMPTDDYAPPKGKRCYELSIPKKCVKPGMGFMKYATTHRWWPDDDVAKPKVKTERPAITAHTCRFTVADKLSTDARGLYDFACKNNVRFSMQPTFNYIEIARTLKDEDGVRPLIRTGYEVELFKRLKARALNL